MGKMFEKSARQQGALCLSRGEECAVETNSPFRVLLQYIYNYKQKNAIVMSELRKEGMLFLAVV